MIIIDFTSKGLIVRPILIRHLFALLGKYYEFLNSQILFFNTLYKQRIESHQNNLALDLYSTSILKRLRKNNLNDSTIIVKQFHLSNSYLYLLVNGIFEDTNQWKNTYMLLFTIRQTNQWNVFCKRNVNFNQGDKKKKKLL